jgi:glycolate oxidase iron-sulfur subunit
MNAKPRMDADDVYRCVKCGLCLMTCPVYREVLEETAGPRAKVQLIKHYAENDLPPSERLNEIVLRCLMCGTCTSNCPSGVRHDALFMRMRSSLVDDFGENWIKKVIFHLLTHDNQLRWAAKFAALGRSGALDKLVQQVKLGHVALKKLPKINKTPFRSRMAEVIEPLSTARGTVLYFTGCGTNYVYDEVGRATVAVLHRMGYRVEIPKDQTCCGLPLFFQGNAEKSLPMILKNIKIFNRRDIAAVVVDCATCGSALRKEYAEVLAASGIDPEGAGQLAGRVKDICEFLWEHMDLLRPLLRSQPKETVVTYHSPCHLRNAQGVNSQVEDLLLQLPGVRYVKSADFDRCCGGGGTFFYDYPDISRRIVEKKIANAQATGAQKWATGCPGCRLNLSANLPDRDPIEVVHPVEIVAAVLKD